jgi:hypothetical protein
VLIAVLVVSCRSNVFSCVLIRKEKAIARSGNLDFCSAANIRVPRKNGLLPESAVIDLKKRTVNKLIAKLNMTSKKHFTPEEAKKIGEGLDVKWDKFDIEQYRMGLDVEMEHGLIDKKTNITNDDPVMTGKIALAHLNEFPDYYTRLEKLEKEAEEYWKK